MSVKLTNRLDQIEQDIRLMMMLQKCGNISRTNSIRSNVGTDSRSILQRNLSNDKIQSSYNSPNCSPSSLNSCITSPDIIQPPTTFATSNENNLSEIECEQTKQRNLEEELIRLKSELSSTTKSKDIALSLTNQFKIQNVKMKQQLDETNNKLLDMTKEKEYLCKCLERGKENLKANQNKMLQSDTPTLCNDKGLETIEDYKVVIKSLKDSVLMLTKQLQQKEGEKQALLIQQNKLDYKLKKQKDVLKKLTELNQKLTNSIRLKHESFITFKNKAYQLETELIQCKTTSDKSQQELEKLQLELENERVKANKIPEEISEQLRVLKEKEQQSLETIQNLNNKFKEMEEHSNKETQKEIAYWRGEAKGLHIKVEEMTNKLVKYQEKEASILAIKRQNQLCTTASAILQTKANELQRFIDEQKKKIDELEFIRQQQDIVISSQNEQLLSKDEQIRLQEQENEIVKEKCLRLDKQIESLRLVFDSKETPSEEIPTNNWHKIHALENKIDELKLNLGKRSEIKDEILSKERNNQAENLKKLAAALESSKEKLEMTVRELDREKQSSKVMLNGLEKLNVRKDKLEGMMLDLEESCNDLALEKDRYAGLCDELEKQLVAERQQRLQERQALLEERNRAFEVAKMAAVTLIETVDDYEVVTKAQVKAKNSINSIIKNKQKRRPGCPGGLRGRIKNKTEDENPDNTCAESPGTSYISLIPSEEAPDEMQTLGNQNTNQENCCFTNAVVEPERVIGIPIPVTALNPFAGVQPTTLIPTAATTPQHACWFGNCGCRPNQGTTLHLTNPYQLAMAHQCKCQAMTNLQQKTPKSQSLIKGTSSRSANLRKKHTK